jgi:hypothetical protein
VLTNAFTRVGPVMSAKSTATGKCRIQGSIVVRAGRWRIVGNPEVRILLTLTFVKPVIRAK